MSNTPATATTDMANSSVHPLTVRESQLDELVQDEVRNMHENILAESEKYEKIIEDWLRKSPNTLAERNS